MNGWDKEIEVVEEIFLLDGLGEVFFEGVEEFFWIFRGGLVKSIFESVFGFIEKEL